MPHFTNERGTYGGGQLPLALVMTKRISFVVCGMRA
jgi:hypothetical protein